MINTVKIQGNSFLVNGNMSVPNAEGNTDYQAVQRWLLGKTDDWLLLEETFNQETEAYDNYIDITTYDVRLAQYDIDIAAYTSWTFGDGDKPEEPTFPIKPEGYYTADEVTESETAHAEWQTLSDAFVPDEFTDSYHVVEPDVLSLPVNLIEPIIAALPTPVPNVPTAEFTQVELDAQLEAQRRKDIKDTGLALINTIFPALKDIDEIQFQAEFWLSINPTARQATVDFQKVIDIYTVAKQAVTNNTPTASVVWP